MDRPLALVRSHGHLALALPGTIPATRKPVSDARWRSAQRLELEFWARWQTIGVYRNLDIPAYWREEVAHFPQSWESFNRLRVLDVGCGPLGLIHFLDHAAERIRIDPLLPEYGEKLPLEGPQLSISGMGESLPLADSCIDLAICFNALDHMLDPEAALAELARVVRPGGTVLLMIHSFPGWLRPFYAVDRMHPHHYTAAAFRSLVESHFRVASFSTIRRHFDIPNEHKWTPSSWKYRAGGLVVSSTYVRALRPS